MKAIEYFEKYDEAIISDKREGSLTNVIALVKELTKEAHVLTDKRKPKCAAAYAAIFKELNQKWNSISYLYTKKYGCSPLKKDGYMDFCKSQMPDTLKMQLELLTKK